MNNLLEYSKIFIRLPFIVISRTVFYTLLGLLANIIFLVLFFAKIVGLWWAYIVIIFLGLIVILPVLRFFLGKYVGVIKAIKYLYSKIKTPINEFLSSVIGKIVESGSLQKLSNSQKGKYIKAQFESMKDLPRGFRLILPVMSLFLPIDEITQVYEKFQDDNNKSEFKNKVVEILNEKISENLSMSWVWVLILLVVNVAIFWLITYIN